MRLRRGAGSVPHRERIARQTLTVRIFASSVKAVRNTRGEILGESFADSNGGTLASIFVASAQEEAMAAGVPWVTVLSGAAAHEIGHLLLGAGAHASRGLMKRAWDRDDYLALYQNRLHFAPEQTLILAARYGRATTTTNLR